MGRAGTGRNWRGAQGTVYALKALIANLLTAKGLTQLRAGLRANVKGLTIIID